MKLNITLLVFLFGLEFAATSQAQVAYLTNDSHGVVTADSMGICSNDYPFSPDRLFPKKTWKGDWIWLSKTRFDKYQGTRTEWINNEKRGTRYCALFRKEFDIGEVPSLAILCITADVSFRAYLNGNFVCQGPPNIGSDYLDSRPPEHWFFSTHDVARYVHPGRNVIAVDVYSFDLALSETTSGEGKFICDLNVGLNSTVVVTDTSWKCNLDTCLSIINGEFVYNATREIPDWRNIVFDDSKWPTASIKDAIKSGYLTESQIPSTIRYPLEAKHTSSLFRRVLHNEVLVLDFGKVLPAYYSISLTGHEGDTVKVYPREKLDGNRPFVYICNEGRNSYTTPQLSVFRYLTVNVGSTRGLKIDSMYALFSSYPVDYAGSFSCSDTFYTQLWSIIRWTTQMCMQSHYLDSPNHQEPISDTGDYLIESLLNYYAFGDRWLARQDLVKTARMLRKNDYRMFHTSYSLLWVQMLCDYFQYTGDTLLVKALLPGVNKLNGLFATYLDKNSLLSQAPNYMFMDWVTIGRFDAHHPPAMIGTGYLSAFYYKSLIDAAHLNEIDGNRERSRDDLRLAETIKNGINKLLWDQKKGIYKDGIAFTSHVRPSMWLPADMDTVTHSPQFNTLAVLYDIAPNSRQASIMDYIVHQKETEVQPYFMYFVLSALSHIHKFDTDGLTLINKWKKDIDSETYTLKEKWPDRTGYAGDLSHAWGGSPLIFLSGKILGITPEKPGYKEIQFVPYVSDRLIWAKGTVPLCDGSIVSVYWERSGKSIYTYHIRIPAHHKAVLYSPGKLSPYSLRVNQKSYGKVTEIPMVLSNGPYVIEYTKMGD